MDDMPYADKMEEELSEIVRAEMNLADSIGALFVELEALEQRLGRVLRPEEPIDPQTNAKELAAVRPTTTQATDFLNGQAYRVQAEVVRVRNILQRLGL